MANALRFVQEGVRYLGIEEGAYPDGPDSVLIRRFGDCKGKARLLATLLRLLGFEGHVALVSSHWEKGVAGSPTFSVRIRSRHRSELAVARHVLRRRCPS